jgi:hypothetical protein
MTSSRPLVRAAAVAFALAAASFVLAPPAAAQAGGGFSVGQRLSKEQARTLGALPRVEINGQAYRVLHTGVGANGLPLTTLLDRRGMVGQTYHELVIADQPTGTVRQQAGAALAAAQVQYYDSIGMTVARFPTLEHAIAALAQVRAALPGAEVGLPIAFDRPRAR